METIKQVQLPDGNTYDIKPDIAKKSGMFYGAVDSTSTATVFTASIDGITEYYDGLAIMLKNGVVTSTTNFTVNINGLGGKPVYTNLAAATRDTTIFNVNYTMLFVYDSTRVSGGGWICYRGYDANTNTIGYQLRTNSTVMNVSDTARYYKIYFTSADGTMWVPASVNSTNNATSARPVNQRPINPFGRIVYTSANTSYTAGSNLAATTIWDQYTVTLGYSFNRTGAALTLTVEAPVYVKCAPQSDGSAIMDADTPYVQALPSTDDGKIYIFLGIATSATVIELVPHHPVYYYKDGAIRLWTNAASGSTDEALTDSEVEDAVDGALEWRSVTIAFTNTLHPEDFVLCYIYDVPTNNLMFDNKIGEISTADGEVTVTIPETTYGIWVDPQGVAGEGDPTIDSGTDIVLVDHNMFAVNGDGTITYDHYDWNSQA